MLISTPVLNAPSSTKAALPESVAGEKTIEVTNPATGKPIAYVKCADASVVDAAVAAAKAALPGWAGLTVKRRAQIMLRFHALIEEHRQELVDLIVKENGKNVTEAAGDVAKGLETVEWACSLPQLAQGRILPVSSGVTCHEEHEPVGVVASIVPFNFPFMVPMWTLPIALTCGNTVVLKPSEKVPLTMARVAELFTAAGLPDGVLQIVHGGVPTVEALTDHPDVNALTFVGSSRVAKIVHDRARSHGKKVIALGGAKNHLVAAPDADVAMAAADIVASFAGCAGQRCMAAAVLLTIGEQPALLDAVLEKARALKPGQRGGEVGPLIDAASAARVTRLVDAAEADGAEVLLDGRKGWAPDGAEFGGGHWVGPTIIKFPASMAAHPCLVEELFGPVLAVRVVADANEALKIENADPHGNAACIYTQSGATADWYARRFGAAMVGVNIGVPVPREPFSFGGMEGSKSKYGEHDITGDGALRFFTWTRKVTTKWSTTPNAPPDAASFAATM